MEEWLTKRAELERELLKAKQTVIEYEGASSPHTRTVTDSDYRQAKRDVITLYTEIQNGDHEASRPADKFAGLSADELRKLREEKAEAYRGGAGSTRDAAEILRIDTLLQAMETEEGAETV
ncbi:hypothetical protein [Ornithinibacillus sp. FSL M8-0202]|uniref:hypothetical protein n=1 Tax=Ornithinibacillus sp. FSL M8-0202 TaxID=2921616 RepID=UPI0030D5FD5B